MVVVDMLYCSKKAVHRICNILMFEGQIKTHSIGRLVEVNTHKICCLGSLNAFNQTRQPLQQCAVMNAMQLFICVLGFAVILASLFSSFLICTAL